MKTKSLRPILLMSVFSIISTLNTFGAVETPIDTCSHLDEVVVTGVTGKTPLSEIPASVSLISHGTLNLHPSQNIIAAISRQPGVGNISTGSGISKPVIRGLGYNRVLVVNDGVRQEGQQWGDEHGVEVDGKSVYSAEIIKGPASLMYGSDALAGVVIFNDAPVMSEGSMYAEADAGYASNNGLADYSIDFRGNSKGLLWNWRWSQRWAHDYKAPLDGYVPNTRFRDRALKGMLGLDRSWGVSKLILSYYHFTPGITEAGDSGESDGSDYKTILPYQTVGHYKITSDNSIKAGAGLLKVIVAYQHNRRREFEEEHDHAAGHHGEDHNHEEGEAGLDFLLRTLNYDVRYVLPQIQGWSSNAGINGMWQSSSNKGTEYLIPAYRSIDAGIFLTALKKIATTITISGGLRYDIRHLHSLPLESDGTQRFMDFTRNFSAISGSIGAVYNVDRQLSLKINAAHGFRAPNMSEMGSNGVHHGTFRYEIGDSELKAEHSWQFDLGADYTGEIISASAAFFTNRISNYIYLRGEDEMIDRTLVYRFMSGDALLLGGEMAVTLHPLKWLHFHNALSMINARLLHAAQNEKYLPYIPAPRWLSTIHCDIPVRSRYFKGLFAEIEADLNARQNKVMTAGGTETPTPGYTLWNATAGTDVYLKSGRKLCRITLEAENIFNKAYQSHLSRLKYADTYPLTGRYGYNNMGRNITIRVVFPVEFN